MKSEVSAAASTPVSQRSFLFLLFNKHASLHEHCCTAIFYTVTQAPAVDPFDALAGSLPSAKPSESPKFTGPEVTEV